MSEIIDQASEIVEPVETEVEPTEVETEQLELTPEEQEAKTAADAEKHKRGVQERINKAVGKQREAERERDALARKVEEYEAKLNPVKEPDINDFDSLEEYQKAEREFGAQQARAEFRQGQNNSTQQVALNEQLKTYQSQEAELARTIPEYTDVISVADQIIGEAGLPVDVSRALIKNPNGARIGFEICKDTDQLIDFLNMSPTDQLIRIGEISAGLPKVSKVPNSASLPKPITPVSGNASAKKDITKMTTEEYIAHRNKTANRR